MFVVDGGGRGIFVGVDLWRGLDGIFFFFGGRVFIFDFLIF